MGFARELGPANTDLEGTCDVRRVLDVLGPYDADALHRALADAGQPSAGITTALAAIGHTLSLQAVTAHRAGDCPCILNGGT